MILCYIDPLGGKCIWLSQIATKLYNRGFSEMQSWDSNGNTSPSPLYVPGFVFGMGRACWRAVIHSVCLEITWPSCSLWGWREVCRWLQRPKQLPWVSWCGQADRSWHNPSKTMPFTTYNNAALKLPGNSFHVSFKPVRQWTKRSVSLSHFCSSTDGMTKERWHQPVTATSWVCLGIWALYQDGPSALLWLCKNRGRSLIQRLLWGLSWPSSWASKGNWNFSCSYCHKAQPKWRPIPLCFSGVSCTAGTLSPLGVTYEEPSLWCSYLWVKTKTNSL